MQKVLGKITEPKMRIVKQRNQKKCTNDKVRKRVENQKNMAQSRKNYQVDSTTVRGNGDWNMELWRRSGADHRITGCGS